LDPLNSAGVVDYIHRMADPLSPYGSDPVFVSSTTLYNPMLLGREGKFYNLTAGSKDVNVNNFPNGFFPRAMKGMPDGFPVVIPPSSDLFRTAVLHAAISDGNYLDTRTTSLALRLSSYNSKLKTMAYGTAVFSWGAAGSISFTVSPPRTVPAFVPNAPEICLLAVLFGLVGVLMHLSGIAAALVTTLAGSLHGWLRPRVSPGANYASDNDEGDEKGASIPFKAHKTAFDNFKTGNDESHGAPSTHLPSSSFSLL